MANNISITWKVVTTLNSPPPLDQDTILFKIDSNPGLYSKFSIQRDYFYEPCVLIPTNVFHQALKSNLKNKCNVVVSESRLPFKIPIPLIQTEAQFHISQIRIFLPNIISLSIKLSDFNSPLSIDQLISIQRLNELKPFSDIVKWVIGMVQTFSHKTFVTPNAVRSKPIIHIDSICETEIFEEYIDKNSRDYIGILIRNPNYSHMDKDLIEKIFKENKEHNVKTSKELLLLNKQGVLYLTPFREISIISKYIKRLLRVQDLFEIALVFHTFLKDYASIYSLDNSLAESTLMKLSRWIDKPNLVFSESTSNSFKWRLLSNKFRLQDQIAEIPELQKILNISKQNSGVQTNNFINADYFFEIIKDKILNSSIDSKFKDIAIYDLEQSQICYNSNAYKSSVVMLGAVLEGLMLGTILKPTVLNFLINDPNCPAKLRSLGLRNPNLSMMIPDKLGFEDFKNIIHHLFPIIERLRIDGIQDFRNAIHTWKSVQNMDIYADFGSARAMSHISSLTLLVEKILP